MNNTKTKISEYIKTILSGTFWVKIKDTILSHKIISSIILLALIGGGYFGYSQMSSSSTSIQYTYGKVTKGNFTVSVSGTGQVATLKTVSIKPNVTGQTQTLGQITSVKVKNGDYVQAGDVIAILDGKTTLQTLNQAKANLTSAQANYDKVVNGLTDEELNSLNNSIESSQTSLINSRQNILLNLKTAYTSVSNLSYLNTDSFFSDPMGSNPLLDISGVDFNNQSIQNNVNTGRYNIGILLNTWREKVKTQSTLVAASTSDEYIISSINEVLSYLNTVRNYYDDMTTLFSLYSISSNSSGESAINSDKSTASNARNSVDSLISSFTSSLQSYQNSITSLKEAKENLGFKQEPASESDLATAKASLDNAKANLTTAQDAYDARIITASFDGQIGGLSAVVGQSVSSNDSLGTLITSEKVVNVTLNETDATDVKAGDNVTITFDSLSDVTLTGYVNYIDPLGTVSSGVVSYSVQVVLNEQNDKVKTGMTATVEIVTATHSDALMVPTTAINTSGKTKYVLAVAQNNSATNNIGTTSSTTLELNTNGSSSKTNSPEKNNIGNTSESSLVKVTITTGLANSTSTEILTGLTEGQTIVVSKKSVTSATTKTAATSATTNSSSRGMMEMGGMGGGPGAAGF